MVMVYGMAGISGLWALTPRATKIRCRAQDEVAMVFRYYRTSKFDVTR